MQKDLDQKSGQDPSSGPASAEDSQCISLKMAVIVSSLALRCPSHSLMVFNQCLRRSFLCRECRQPGCGAEQEQTHSSFPPNNLAFACSHTVCPHKVLFKESVLLVFVFKFLLTEMFSEILSSSKIL